MTEKTTNHMKAPKCASFVANMRQVFGNDQVTVTYVSENDVHLGEPLDVNQVFDPNLVSRKETA